MMHADQLVVPVGTARALVDEQFPQWRELPIRPMPGQGTVNAIFRLGGELTVRFPLQPRAGARQWLERDPAVEPAPCLARESRAEFPEPSMVE